MAPLYVPVISLPSKSCTTSDWVALFVRLLQKECRRVGPGSKVLDIGCGEGIHRQPGFTDGQIDQAGYALQWLAVFKRWLNTVRGSYPLAGCGAGHKTPGFEHCDSLQRLTPQVPGRQ